MSGRARRIARCWPRACAGRRRARARPGRPRTRARSQTRSPSGRRFPRCGRARGASLARLAAGAALEHRSGLSGGVARPHRRAGGRARRRVRRSARTSRRTDTGSSSSAGPAPTARDTSTSRRACSTTSLPRNELGLASVWINRLGESAGPAADAGAARPRRGCPTCSTSSSCERARRALVFARRARPRRRPWPS